MPVQEFIKYVLWWALSKANNKHATYKKLKNITKTILMINAKLITN